MEAPSGRAYLSFRTRVWAVNSARSRESARDRNQDHAGKRWEAEVLAKFKLLFGKAIEIVMPGKLNGRAERREGLHEHLALDFASSGSACHLSEKLKGSLSRPEVRQMQAQIGVDDPDEGHVGKVKSLGDHLRADKNIDRAFLEGLQGFAVGILA